MDEKIFRGSGKSGSMNQNLGKNLPDKNHRQLCPLSFNTGKQMVKFTVLFYTTTLLRNEKTPYRRNLLPSGVVVLNLCGFQIHP